jgi:hypothetical protein
VPTRCGALHGECVFAFPPRALLPAFVAKARADGLRGSVIALVVWWGRLRPAAAGSPRSTARSRDRCALCARRQAPPRSLAPSLIAGTRRERLVSAVTAVPRRQRRDRAMTAGTGVIAVSAVIAGFVFLGPSGPLRTVAKGAVPPVSRRKVGTGPPPPQ